MTRNYYVDNIDEIIQVLINKKFTMTMPYKLYVKIIPDILKGCLLLDGKTNINIIDYENVYKLIKTYYVPLISAIKNNDKDEIYKIIGMDLDDQSVKDYIIYKIHHKCIISIIYDMKEYEIGYTIGIITVVFGSSSYNEFRDLLIKKLIDILTLENTDIVKLIHVSALKNIDIMKYIVYKYK